MSNPTQGITSAPKLTESATNVLHAITQYRPFTGGAYSPAVFSVYVQQSTRRYVAIRLRDAAGGANGATATFDTQAGSFTYQANDGSGATRTVGFENAGNSWWRIWIAVSGITPVNGWEASVIVCNASGVPAAYLGDGTSGIFAGFTQLEAGTTPGPYIATTTAPIDERFTAVGIFSFNVTVSNEFGSASRAFTQTVGYDGVAQVPPAVTTTTLASGAVGTAYHQPLIATGSQPISWSLTGQLTPGLSLLAGADRNKLRNPYMQGAAVGGPNLVLRSQELTTTPWQIGANLTANGLDGTLAGIPAYRFTSTSTSNSYVRQTVTAGLVAGATYTASFLCDTNAGGATYLRVEGPNTQTSFTVTQLEAGLFRYTCTVTYPASGATGITIHAGRIDAPNGTTFRATAVQLTQSAYLLPYVPTTTAAVDSAGTVPTYWAASGTGGSVTRTVVATGIESGLTFIDIRYQFSASATVNVGFDATNVISAATGQTWTSSFYASLAGGNLTNLVVRNTVAEFSSVAAFLTNSVAAFVPSDAPLASQRQTLSRTLNNASTAFVQSTLQIVASGPADIVIRIAAPQLEQAAAATEYADPRYAYITGTPTAPGSYQVTATASNAYGSASRPFTIPIDAAPVTVKRQSPWSKWITR